MNGRPSNSFRGATAVQEPVGATERPRASAHANARAGSPARLGRGAAALVAALWLAACGSGSGSDNPGPTGDEAEDPGSGQVAATPLVLRNDSSHLRLAGTFEPIEAYLSESPRVLRSVGREPASATFALPIERAGYYEVSLWWPQAAPAGSAADIVVEHANGQTGQRVDQTALGGQWNTLGTFAFDPAGRGTLIMRKASEASPLLVDAVRVRFVGEQARPLAFGTTEMALAEPGRPYSAVLEATGGLAPYEFGLAESRLPAGLVLDRSTGEISGVPGEAGSFAFSVELRDAAGARAVQAFSIEVLPAGAPAQEPAGPVQEPAPGPTPQPEPDPAPGSDPDPTPSPDPDPLPDGQDVRAVVGQMRGGEWRKVNLNHYSDVWTPAQLRPLFGRGNPTPEKIIRAWSSFAWDSRRANLWLYGGGHANYRGNDTYIWRGATRKWERASLPSAMKNDAFGNWNAIDGAGRAPASAHTYDNNIYLPILDRYLTLGGAVDPGGGHYYRTNEAGTGSRRTGPYLFDPRRAHPWRVGGTTGSHVQREGAYPEVVGGTMWSNRESFLNASRPVNNFVNGCTAYAEEAGKDVVYARTEGYVYRYTIHSLGDSTRDTWEPVGVHWGAPGTKATCGYDPVRKALVRTGGHKSDGSFVPFVYWDMSTPGPNNKDVQVVPVDPTGEFMRIMSSRQIRIEDCGLDFDRAGDRFALWCGDGRVWMLRPPRTLSPSGWTIALQPAPRGSTPNGPVETGILGKWEYAPDLGAFIGLLDRTEGQVWVYKPVESPRS